MVAIKNRKNAEQLKGKDIEGATSSHDDQVLVYDHENEKYVHTNTIDGGTP